MAEQAGGPACEYKTEHFKATEYRASGGRRSVRVKGVAACPSSGFRLALELASPPIVATPEVLHLKLVEQKPTGTVLTVVTDTGVEGEFPIADEVEWVLIRNLGINIPVTEE
ncbi:hypothetical protein [Streptomyces sp. KS 21]|uniref:hypothetical protein n=1 Tax=Streptomyces sp. KS 21 TaxID=2485150 RepID=UPI001063395F|nr:hypothetical protein [Streptomyces sp. KS 21]TDU80050.1 hypothetical protein EDD91_6880 [Streptomyces sp. KS 21]